MAVAVMGVTETPAVGGEVAVPAGKITIDGRPLDKVILSHSTGIEAGRLDVKLHATQIENLWYISNLDFNVG
ncbi:hypothetical protein [Streptomyces phaeofaciens]|uniref:hypothetical protein n=1 Tax=Streptomyces phaeofaciens TaxID=68254 RepID=UPI00368BA523